jgi:TetR/AcrR family transcriptional regulator, cholesterol catabolism regulator
MRTANKYDYLLNSARDLFISSGIKGVSIDELSHNAGISKKTFYTYFENKNDLVLKVIQRAISEIMAELVYVNKKSENAVHELILQRNVFKRLNRFKLLFSKHALRYYPDATKAINDFRHNFFKCQLEANLEKGIETGLYRSEINIKETATVFVQYIGMFFCNCDFTTGSLLTSNELFLNGIVNSSGKTLVPQFSNV